MAEVKQSTGTFFIPWVSTLKNVMYCMSESPSFMLIWVVTNMSDEYRALKFLEINMPLPYFHWVFLMKFMFSLFPVYEISCSSLKL